MLGIGTITNVAAITAGSLFGIALKNKLSERYHNVLLKVIGMFTVIIGIKPALQTGNIVLVLISLILGAIAGELIGIETGLEAFGLKLKSLTRSDSSTFLEGFVTTSLLYCVGPMAILGSISDGLNGQHEILFAKSVMDGVVSVGFAATLGVGVIFSTVPVFVYQFGITVAAYFLGQFLPEMVINELSATGGFLILAIGLNFLISNDKDRRIPVGNLLPALVFVMIFSFLLRAFSF